MKRLFVLLLLLLNYILCGPYVSITKDDKGVWWFTQNGNNFISIGVNHVNNGGPDDGVGGRESADCNYPLCGDTLSFAPKLGFAPYFNSTMARWGSQENWAQNVVSRISSWNFNSIGGWSATIVEQALKPGQYYAHLLDMATTWQKHMTLPDMFTQEILAQVDSIAKKECAPRANDTRLLGWQTDNELDWGSPFLMIYLQYPSSAPGLTRAIQFLQQKYPTIADLNKSWNINATSFNDVPRHLNDKSLNQNNFNNDQTDFLFVVASQYFKITTEAIKRYDPNHLILGARFAWLPDNVVRALIPYVDVIDQHGYDDYPPGNLEHLHQLSGKPIIVGEFSFTAIDSNLPNTRGARAGNPYATQNERANGFTRYVTALLKYPFALGYHWWQYADEPSSGRWPDGEDSNYGVVAIDDDPYQVLTTEMTKFNAQAQDLHRMSYQYYLSNKNN
eukprot:TRINITY_DN11881_c0_g1_i1.p1 TRINITY_DN11881_c0_g1~~TRINITY_DN11881_c0_g1_i1.p1  ORF type:complete len:447 (-),score=80.03 TRINITY_DN11881_c0_g1_i1:101-1441(-)